MFHMRDSSDQGNDLAKRTRAALGA